jgi:hypothetical protein
MTYLVICVISVRSDDLHNTFIFQPSLSWNWGNWGLVAEHDNDFPLSSTEGTNARKLVVTDPSSEVLSPMCSIALFPFHHMIFAGGREPLDWQTSSTRSPADMLCIGVIMRTSLGFTDQNQHKNTFISKHLFYKSIITKHIK